MPSLHNTKASSSTAAIHLSLVLCACFTLSATSQQPDHDNGLSLVTLRRIADQQLAWLQAHQLGFVSVHYFDERADASDCSTDESYLWTEEITARFSESLYHIDSTRSRTADRFSDTRGRRQIHAYNGTVACTYTESVGPKGTRSGGFIWSDPPATHGLAHPLSWLGMWMFQTESPVNLAALVSTEPIGRRVLVDAHAVVWEFSHPSHDSTVAITLQVIDSVPRITQLTESIFATRNGARFLAGTMVLVHETYTMGVPVSQSASMTVSHFTADGDLLRVGRTRMAMTSATPVEREPRAFDVDFPLGTSLVDERFGVGFRVGDTTLNVRGLILETQEPLQSDAGNHLSELMAQSTSQTWTYDSIAHADSRTPWYWLLITIPLVILIWRPRLVCFWRRPHGAPIILLALGILVVPACNRHDDLEHDLVRDIGAVDVTQGALFVSHTFELYNRGTKDANILRIDSTCGCTRAEVSHRSIRPLEYATLEVGYWLDSAGPRSESVIVSYSDGSTQRVTLRAAGLRQAELRAFPIEYREDGRECVVQVLYTTISGGPLSEMPAVASADRVTTRVESWSTRQFGSDGVWQLGRLAVRLDAGESGYPVQIRLTAENGLSISVTIPGPSSVGSR